MKSDRLDPSLEERLRRAAAGSHLTASEVIRQGVTRRVDEILSITAYDQIEDLILSDDGPAHPPQPTDAELAEAMSRDEWTHRRVIDSRS